MFDARLGDLDKARALTLTLTRMAEEHLYFHLVLDRWGDDTVWPTIREIYFKEIPAVLRRPVSNSLRRAVLRGLKVQGLTRFSPQDRLDRATRDLGAIATHLWHGPFLLGDQPTSADFSVAPVLAALAGHPGADRAWSAGGRRLAIDRLIWIGWTQRCSYHDNTLCLPSRCTGLRSFP